MTKLYNSVFTGIARPRPPKLFSFNRRSFFINRHSFFSEGGSEGGSGGSSEGCRSLAIIEPLSYSVIEPFLSFTFPKTCLPVGALKHQGVAAISHRGNQEHPPRRTLSPNTRK